MSHEKHSDSAQQNDGPSSAGASLTVARLPNWVVARRRFVIVFVHGVVMSVAFVLAFLLRFDGRIPVQFLDQMWQTLPLLLLMRLGTFGFYNQYSGWWRHVSVHDLSVLIRAVTVSSALFLGALFLFGHIDGFSRSILLMDWGIALVLFGGMRFMVRMFSEGAASRRWTKGGRRTLIIGAGSAGANLLRQLRADPSSDLHPVGLLDDDPIKHNLQIHGVPVLGPTPELSQIVQVQRIELVVIAVPSASREQMQHMVECCMGVNVEFKIVPSVQELLDGRARLSQLRTVRIEDLLGRPSISFDLKSVEDDLSGRAVLISGAAGSIGSELARQISMFKPSRLILVEQAESPLFFVNGELQRAHPDLEIHPVIADVADVDRMEQLLARFKPSHVFHAAAYKHVPLMEANVEEAVRNNIFGTWHLARAAAKNGAQKFILISTDKAVNPSSVMGATKRVAERIVLESTELGRYLTDFRAVRFGNVLGSDGSVIPLFKKQIAAGGPVTVTHRDVQRYFMTIPEAVQLVLQAAATPAAAGRVSMLDMGEPVKIVELAENLIRLSGLEPYKEMPIVFTGLRPGEKMHEELMTQLETTVPTGVEKVRVVQSDVPEPGELQTAFLEFSSALERGDEMGLLNTIRGLVPECVSPLRDRVSLTLHSSAVADPVLSRRVSG